MSIQASSIPSARVPSTPKAEKMFNLGPVAIGWGLLLAIYAGFRLYQGAFSFEYWMPPRRNLRPTGSPCSRSRCS